MFRGDTRIEYESTLERDFIVRHEFFTHVLDIIPQPTTIEWKDSFGRRQPYTPDFMVYYRLGSSHWENYPKPMLVEVKPEKVWRECWHKLRPKWKAAWRFAKEAGAIFHIWDENRIRGDQAFKNIQFLERYKVMHFDRIDSDWVLKTVENMGCVPFHYLLARHFMGNYRAEGIAHIWHLVATRQIDCDIYKPLNEFTELWVPSYD